ncbi:MAG: hypothetical protein ACJ0BF_05575 [Gammaproteobacteria bacterium]|jgi:hypothetical protein|tara:strand:- start:262 stop:663 length:402 start_codon:yes stop_codon:yes gene_type:complete
MNEYQLWTALNGGLTQNALFQAGTFFLLWVAFRAANQIRIEDSGVLNKTLVSLFSLGIIFNGLTLGAAFLSILESTAYGFDELEVISAGAQNFVETFGTGSVSFDAGPFSNPINTGWWAVITVMLFGRIWTKA